MEQFVSLRPLTGISASLTDEEIEACGEHWLVSVPLRGLVLL